MLVANSFDLWQRDIFFTAAEEVQRSADIMESAYRTWGRQKREGLQQIYLDELCRELQTALGTAKWQLEEFEKAVKRSYKSRADDISMARHRHFVDAIENQISRVESSLKQSFEEQGKSPLRWVDLDEEDCDDLAAFLSGTPQNVRDTNVSKASTITYLEKENRVDVQRSNGNKATAEQENSYNVKATKLLNTRDDIDGEVDRTSGSRTTFCSSNRGDWKIVIDQDEDPNIALAPHNEATPKEKGSRPIFWRQRLRDGTVAKGGTLSYSQFRGIRWIIQIFGRGGGCQRQLQTPIPLKFNSVIFKLALMLSLFLIVPFLLYSA